MPSEDKEKRRMAKEQDKNYVEFRKMQILREIKPTTKAFDMKKFDESFPRETRRNKKQGGEMEFGELMHKYLTLRPDARFATWHGKPKKQRSGGENEKTKTKKKDGGNGAKATKEASKRAMKNYQKALQNNLKFQDEFEDDEYDKMKMKEALEYVRKEDVEGKNKYLLNAIVDNKPFWLIGDPLIPEDEDEEDYVDAKMLTDFINKKITIKCNPAERKKFFIHGPVPQLYNELKHAADKKIVIGNTLESIVASTELKGDTKRKDNSTKCQITWSSRTKALEYVMESCPIEKTAIYESKLENHVRIKST